MRIDLDHARSLAHDLLRLHIPATAVSIPESQGGREFYEAVAKALVTYTHNAEALIWTAHQMGDSALHTLTALESADGSLSAELNRTAGVLT